MGRLAKVRRWESWKAFKGRSKRPVFQTLQTAGTALYIIIGCLALHHWMHISFVPPMLIFIGCTTLQCQFHPAAHIQTVISISTPSKPTVLRVFLFANLDVAVIIKCPCVVVAKIKTSSTLRQIDHPRDKDDSACCLSMVANPRSDSYIINHQY